MPKTIGIACAEYDKRVVATTRGATRIRDRPGRRSDAARTVRTRTPKPVVTLARTKLETERKQSDAVATRHAVEVRSFWRSSLHARTDIPSIFLGTVGHDRENGLKKKKKDRLPKNPTAALDAKAIGQFFFSSSVELKIATEFGAARIFWIRFKIQRHLFRPGIQLGLNANRGECIFRRSLTRECGFN